MPFPFFFFFVPMFCASFAFCRLLCFHNFFAILCVFSLFAESDARNTTNQIKSEIPTKPTNGTNRRRAEQTKRTNRTNERTRTKRASTTTSAARTPNEEQQTEIEIQNTHTHTRTLRRKCCRQSQHSHTHTHTYSAMLAHTFRFVVGGWIGRCCGRRDVATADDAAVDAGSAADCEVACAVVAADLLLRVGGCWGGLVGWFSLSTTTTSHGKWRSLRKMLVFHLRKIRIYFFGAQDTWKGVSRGNEHLHAAPGGWLVEQRCHWAAHRQCECEWVGARER